MPQIGWRDPETGRELEYRDWLAEAYAYGSAMDFPYEILHGIWVQLNRERPDTISATGVLSCPRKTWLEKKVEYYVEPHQNYAAFRGTVIHSVLEDNKPDDAVTEVRVERQHRGVTISGQPDSIRVVYLDGRSLLRDWKSTAKLPDWNPYTHHQQQLNIYRWLLGLDPDTTDLEVVYISMEGVKVMPLKRGGYAKNGRAIPKQVWSDEEVEAFLDERLFPLAASLDADRPVAYENVPEEFLWMCAKYCPVRAECHKLAGKEALAAFQGDKPVKRVVPREQRQSTKGKKKS